MADNRTEDQLGQRQGHLQVRTLVLGEVETGGSIGRDGDDGEGVSCQSNEAGEPHPKESGMKEPPDSEGRYAAFRSLLVSADKEDRRYEGSETYQGVDDESPSKAEVLYRGPRDEGEEYGSSASSGLSDAECETSSSREPLSENRESRDEDLGNRQPERSPPERLTHKADTDAHHDALRQKQLPYGG